MDVSLTQVSVAQERGHPDPNAENVAMRRNYVTHQMHLQPSSSGVLSLSRVGQGAASRGPEGIGAAMSVAEMTILQSHQKQPTTQGKPSTFMVAWEVRRSDATKNTDADLGTSCKPFDQEMRLIGMCVFGYH